MSKTLIETATVKLALEALEEAANVLTSPMFGDAATALQEALVDQPAQQENFLIELTRFAELVRADERNSWPAEMKAMERQVNILTDALAQARGNK